MDTYTIGMTFITWMIIIFMSTGILSLQIFKAIIKSEHMSHTDKIGAEFTLNMFYERKFAGRVALVLWLGASFWSIVFFGWMNKNTNK